MILNIWISIPCENLQIIQKFSLDNSWLMLKLHDAKALTSILF